MSVPIRFKRVIVLHMIKNCFNHIFAWPGEKPPEVPLILGIHGGTGVGKTYQCRVVLREIGAQHLDLSGSDFEHPDSGVPVLRLRERYVAASDLVLDKRSPASALLIDDIDGGLGDMGAEYTIHRQQVSIALMHIADNPTRITIEPNPDDDRTKVRVIETARIPIFATGNNLKILYSPLTRFGRMTLFEWEPTQDEMLDMVHGIFPTLRPNDIRHLLESLDTYHKKKASKGGTVVRPLTIAFYSNLSSRLSDDFIWSHCQSAGTDGLLVRLAKMKGRINMKVVDLNPLIDAGKRMIDELVVLDHLQPNGQQP